MLSTLDADSNGLYDDQERKALLDEIGRLCPNLQIQFDSNGDGMVTVEEQAEGRHPLSMLIDPQDIAKADVRMPWTIDLFSEWISSAYVQEDAPQGKVAEHATRGTIKANASQPVPDLQPTRSDKGGGVEFAANTGQHFTMPGQRDARWNYRWCIFAFRIDGNSGEDRQTVLLDLNRGDESNKSSPKIWYDKDKGLRIQYVGLNAGQLDRRVMTGRNVIADGKTWNVLVCGIRYGQLFASLNGVPLKTDTPPAAAILRAMA